MPMNTANKLTLARVFMIPLFLVIVYWGFPGSRYVALGVYILACLTDLLDGYVARHYNQVSDFGKFADPLADKCLVMAALCWFVETGDMVGWVLAVVLLREFAVSGMRPSVRQKRVQSVRFACSRSSRSRSRTSSPGCCVASPSFAPKTCASARSNSSR